MKLPSRGSFGPNSFSSLVWPLDVCQSAPGWTAAGRLDAAPKKVGSLKHLKYPAFGPGRGLPGNISSQKYVATCCNTPRKACRDDFLVTATLHHVLLSPGDKRDLIRLNRTRCSDTDLVSERHQPRLLFISMKCS